MPGKTTRGVKTKAVRTKGVQTKAKPAPVKQAAPDGTGKFLIVSNRTPDNLSFGSRRVKGEESGDLYIPFGASAVIEDLWLHVPHFAQALNAKRISVSRSDLPPEPRNFDVPPPLQLDDPQLEAQALGIVRKEQYDAISRSLIELDPRRRDTETTDVDFLKTRYTRFLQNVEHREKAYRNRPPLLRDLRTRLAQIRAM